jgi:hypothetical protein
MMHRYTVLGNRGGLLVSVLHGTLSMERSGWLDVTVHGHLQIRLPPGNVFAIVSIRIVSFG